MRGGNLGRGATGAIGSLTGTSVGITGFYSLLSQQGYQGDEDSSNTKHGSGTGAEGVPKDKLWGPGRAVVALHWVPLSCGARCLHHFAAPTVDGGYTAAALPRTAGIPYSSSVEEGAEELSTLPIIWQGVDIGLRGWY